MKFKRILKGFLTVVGILILLAAIAVGGYILYKSYEQRQQVPKEVLLTEQEKTQIAYEENLSYVMEKKDDYDFIVVLNPAHGGLDNGKENAYGKEKDIVLSVCEQVIEANTDESMGIFVTRDDDVAMDDEMRLAFLEQVQPDLFIDVHLNKDAVTSSYGTTVYYNTSYFDRRLSNAELADIMEKSVVSAIEGFACGIYPVEREEMQIILELNMPAVSIACGDLSGETEGQLLTTLPYQKNVAKGILEGISRAKEKME
ncbi:MAG: N-acetylmuramoyl-L-alanine amidase [Lachnospiraceae bacterium]|nr:N-acetylmuramoyl-L-alanine amidase [Lachnospiraceae bacterium]